MHGHRRAFTRLELTVAVAVVAALGAVLAVCSADARRHAELGHSISNLKRYGVGVFTYAADSDDRYPAFSWTATEGHSDFADLELLRRRGGMDSSAAQAVDIIRRLGAHGEDALGINSWIPQVLYNHLPLLEHLGEPILSEWVVTPADEQRIDWKRHPLDCNGLPQGCDGYDYRWVYSSSYEAAPTFWSVEEGLDRSHRVVQGDAHNLYRYGTGVDFQGRRLQTTRHPSQKAMVFASFAWYFGPRRAYFAYPEARLPVLAADGAVDVRVTADSNPGWRPDWPASPQPSRFLFTGETLSGEPNDDVIGHFKWTRWGALGRDWGGLEVTRALKARERR